MTYSLALVNGDLAPLGGQLQIVQGVDKLKQDIDLWLRESFGVDRFHPLYGSALESFIGSVVTGHTRAEIIEEISRVLRNYQAITLRAFKERPQAFSASELPMQIIAVDARVNYDTVTAGVIVANGDRAPVTIKTSNSTVGA